MISELPQNLSALTPERMSHAAGVRDNRISALFKRWPTLSKVETSELKRLYNERLRLAKSVGTMRRHRRLRRGSGGENAGRELRRSYVAGDPERFRRLLTEQVRVRDLPGAGNAVARPCTL